MTGRKEQERVKSVSAVDEPVVSTSTFVAATAGVFSLGLLLGIRRAFKQDDIEQNAGNSLLQKNKKLSLEEQKKVAEAAKLGIKLKKSSGGITRAAFSALTKNQAGVALAFRAFMIGSALCFSTFLVGGGVFMYANNLKSTEDLNRFLRNRMQNSQLGKLVKAKDYNPEETAEVEQWFEELFTNPWKVLENSGNSTNGQNSNKSDQQTAKQADTTNEMDPKIDSEEPVDAVTAVVSYKWRRLLFKVGLGEDPGAPPITKLNQKP